MNNFNKLLMMCLLTLLCVTVGAQTWELDAMSAGDAYRVGMNAAKAQFDKKNYDGAIAELNKVLQKSPNDYDALFFRALSFYNLKRTDQALIDLTKVTAADNSDKQLRGSGYALRAVIYMEKGETARAAADGISAIRTNPGASEAYRVLEKTLTPESYLAEMTKAIKDFENDIFNNNAQLYLARAYYYFSRGKLDLAAPDTVEALKQLYENNEGAWSFLDSYYKDKPELYAAELTKIINYRYNDPTEALVRRANIFFNQNKFDLAIADSSAAISKAKITQVKDNLGAAIYRIRAYSYANTNRLEQAVADLNLVLASNFYNWGDFDGRAQMHCLTGKKAEAKADEKKVVELGGKVSKPCL